MKKIGFLTPFVTLFLLFSFGCANSGTMKNKNLSQVLNGEAKILQSWQGDYPTAQLDLLPENQRKNSVGFISKAEIFKAVWNAFKPEEAVPHIDFNTNIVLFVKNTQFYNRIRIGKVNATNGVAKVLAMETMSAMPIEDKVAMSMVVIAKHGITAIKSGDKIIQIYETK